MGVVEQETTLGVAAGRERNGAPADGVRKANWTLAARAVSGLGDTWDLEETEFEFLCECGRACCQSTVSVALVDYVDARSRGHDVVARWHEDALDLVLRQTDDYKVIARARSARNSGFVLFAATKA
jgi:hypothetical protein